MKSTSLFIENMFNLIDKDNDGFVSFREFMNVIIIFSSGKIFCNVVDLNVVPRICFFCF